MPEFKVCADRFELDGKPFQLIAGAIHYFRVPCEYWRDRLLKLKACGFNAVETYVAWNAHMPREDVFVTDGLLDIGAFLSLAQELGLYAIVRPGPYICSEWEFGGLPWWLLKYDCALRCMDRTYLHFADQYLDHLIPLLLPHLSTRGGNVLMLQVENEYGSYGDDKDYLTHLKDAYIQRGVDVPLLVYGCDNFIENGQSIKNKEVSRRVACAMGEKNFPRRIKPPVAHGGRDNGIFSPVC